MRQALIVIFCLGMFFCSLQSSFGENLKVFQPTKGDFSIAYPEEDWAMDMDSGMTLNARGGFAFIDILTVPLTLLRTKAGNEPLSLDTFAEIFCKNEIIRRSMIREYGAELLEQGQSVINDSKVFFFMYTTRADKDPKTMLRIKEYALLTEERGYILKYYASPDQFYRYLPMAEEIIKTFKPVATIIHPGASLEKGLDQEIRLLSVAETRETPGGLWLAGKGYARINSESAYYYWESVTAPQVEVELLVDALSLENCKTVLREKIPAGKALMMKGQGVFESKEIKNAPVGVFQLKSLTACEIISEK